LSEALSFGRAGELHEAKESDGMSAKSVVLLTHVNHFVGPGAVRRLLREEMTVVCHDASFADREARAAFAAEIPGAEVLERTGPAEIVAETVERFGRLDALISNDPYRHPGARR
jgi:NAD(P)-dependent dehydrogenase (short-subunit alcohol dehydrogenase family)